MLFPTAAFSVPIIMSAATNHAQEAMIEMEDGRDLRAYRDADKQRSRS